MMDGDADQEDNHSLGDEIDIDIKNLMNHQNS